MDDVKDSLITECKNMLSRQDIKEEIKNLFKPIIDLVLREIYPYIFLSMIFVFISFILILGIFILLLRNNLDSFNSQV
tara:strand:+ start:820 stop:1053 length:234 start_codon:yes stop_codon:yes gene_type:complete